MLGRRFSRLFVEQSAVVNLAFLTQRNESILPVVVRMTSAKADRCDRYLFEMHVESREAQGVNSNPHFAIASAPAGIVREERVFIDKR